MEQLNYKIHSKENTYFVLKLIFSIPIYGLIAWAIYGIATTDAPISQFVILITYGIFIAIYIFFATGVMIGHIKGNGIRITKIQFPEIYNILEKQCEQLNMEIPPVYMLQNGGLLNAFATRFVGRNYVVIYSEIFDLAFEQGVDELSFIIAHELGHIKRNHISKRLWTFPSIIIPFLNSAYSRACEYTCDNIGKSLSPKGAALGLLILASGKTVYKKVNVHEYLSSSQNEKGFWKWFAEKVSSHPNLPKRIENID
jgi:Zn-dependent protease with chaperone function